jgi:hypothetical protein
MNVNTDFSEATYKSGIDPNSDHSELRRLIKKSRRTARLSFYIGVLGLILIITMSYFIVDLNNTTNQQEKQILALLKMNGFNKFLNGDELKKYLDNG